MTDRTTVADELEAMPPVSWVSATVQESLSVGGRKHNPDCCLSDHWLEILTAQRTPGFFSRSRRLPRECRGTRLNLAGVSTHRHEPHATPLLPVDGPNNVTPQVVRMTTQGPSGVHAVWIFAGGEQQVPGAGRRQALLARRDLLRSGRPLPKRHATGAGSRAAERLMEGAHRSMQHPQSVVSAGLLLPHRFGLSWGPLASRFPLGIKKLVRPRAASAQNLPGFLSSLPKSCVDRHGRSASNPTPLKLFELLTFISRQ